MASPLMPLAASLARWTTSAATSSTETVRPGGYDAARSAQTSSDSSLLEVRTQPGQIALQVTPQAPASRATARVNPTSACFEVTYVAISTPATRPAVEAMLMIRPTPA